MDFVTLTADEFAMMGVDEFADLPLEDTSSSSSASSPSSISSASSASSNSSSSGASLYPKTISGDRYLAIAQFYAEAYEGQVALITPIDAAVQQLGCQEDVTVTTSLLPAFDTASKLMTTQYEAVDGCLGAVRAIQRHVEATSGLSVDEWIAEAVDGGVVPYAWALLSKQAGYEIDSVIDWTTESSSS